MADESAKPYEYYSSVEESTIEWLWYPYIPYGKLTIVEGDPGEGKSTFMLHLAALLTKGKPTPDGQEAQPPMTVIYQCPEDDISDTIKPRLISADADCDRVAFIRDNGNRINFEDSRIEKTIEATGARLFIFDPLQSFLSQDSDMNNAGKMRTILGKLSIIASRHQCAIVIIGHMNKSNGNKNLYRGLGSIDISAIARSILMVARDNDEPSVRYMFPVKANLAPEGPPIGFRFDRDTGFSWIGVCDLNVAMETAAPDSRAEKSGTAADIIISMLKEGPVPSADIFERMAKVGVSDRTVYTLKSNLRIASVKINNVWYWKL